MNHASSTSLRVDLREVVNAILHLLRTGCSWRQLPSDFPVWQAVYGYLLMVSVITAANVQDRDGGRQVLQRVHEKFPGVKLIWADGGYAGKLVVWAQNHHPHEHRDRQAK